MDVYLIRHADAVQLEYAGGMDDFDRPLTDLGRSQAQHLAQALPNRGAKIERLFVSPLVRAKQTAEPLIAAWGLNGDQVVECDELAPEVRFSKLARRISKHPAGSVGLVGHSPDLNEFAGWLIGSKKAQVAMEKGGVALIRVDGEELDKGTGELIWLMGPDWV
jgi:phosphohistidine phosphatase